MEKSLNPEEKYLKYKEKPLVRCQNTIYYGNMNDDYVAKIDILKTEKIDKINCATEISIQLIDTNPNTDIMKRIKKTSLKNNLYDAIDIAGIWLERSASA
jgi:hypothetical protein